MPIHSAPDATRQRLVILVDGDEQSRLACRSGLAEAGFEVITVTDAATAVLVARFAPPDVVIVDLDSPASSSLIGARDLRAELGFHRSQIIGLTAEVPPQRSPEPDATRLDQLVLKPADSQRLLEALGESLVPA
jgi:DNA-binding response OmpR family regulator